MYTIKKLVFAFILVLVPILAGFQSAWADKIFYTPETLPFPSQPPFAGETFYPEGNPFIQKNGMKFWLYNDGSGEVDLNLSALSKQKAYISPPVVSPNFYHIVYTEMCYMPNSQVNARMFYVPVNLPKPHDDGAPITLNEYMNSYRLKLIQHYRSEILGVGTDYYRNYDFKTLTVVDWSYDSSRVLIKEKVGRTFTGLAGTVPWVYDMQEEKVYRLEVIRKAIINYWIDKESLDLNQYSWDINVLGWDKDSNNIIIVNAYLYPSKISKKFLGCWSIDVGSTLSQLLSLENENWPVGRYGLVPEVY